ncbi:MAG: hypothetical protein ABUT20_09280 [Bacteroidota bacterium]
MNAAAKSIFYFSIYIYLVGITLIFIPNVLLKTIHLPETKEVWIRIVGVLVFLLAFYYHRSAAANTVSFFRLTIPARFFILLTFIVFVLLKLVSPVLIVFGVIDALGAMWTWLALRKVN